MDELSPSAKYVLSIIRDEDGEVSRQTLHEESGLPEPTLDRALNALEEEDRIVLSRDNADLRQVVINMRTN